MMALGKAFGKVMPSIQLTKVNSSRGQPIPHSALLRMTARIPLGEAF